MESLRGQAMSAERQRVSITG